MNKNKNKYISFNIFFSAVSLSCANAHGTQPPCGLAQALSSRCAANAAPCLEQGKGSLQLVLIGSSQETLELSSSQPSGQGTIPRVEQ